MKGVVLGWNLILVTLALALSGCSTRSDSAVDGGLPETAAADVSISDLTATDVADSAAKVDGSEKDLREPGDSLKDEDSPAGLDIIEKEEVMEEVVEEVLEEVLEEVVEEVGEEVQEEVDEEVG